MKTLKFSNNDEIPAIGLGTWKSEKGKVQEAVKIALNEGYRHIDCAAIYDNEAEIGNALSEVFSQGKIRREDVWITSKLWNDSHKKEDVIPALRQTLKDLQLKYLDLYLIHWPVAFRHGVGFPTKNEDYLSLEEVPIIETWNAMLEAKKQGLVKHVGVSNFSVKKLKDLMAQTQEFPEMNQVELHPFLQQHELLEFCKENNIHLTAYSPLGSGDRNKEMKAENEPSLLEEPVILKIAEKHSASPGQILIQWAVARGTAVIPKSTSKGHIIANLESDKIELDEADMKEIAELDRHFRYVNGEFFVTKQNPYENIYDE
ncbi:alcohol dehydrogenase (NADP+) [Salinimicrobium catena]|uniref:Alcohol dehydrogenase (NADP+) n=1 Tax=Salinimicrobium catena TaxID=390640 RepID=A0A1H5PAJ8_9FLAO|nr:aldo/keto reductase [Salinimicrobium catena]SDL74977.1 alcohol dehydrogenase (NADP+) [Salinimicrobium catena]SEF10088.1 alcohol dehydrogenase (NADP+) [Salinimicrobium catena]